MKLVETVEVLELLVHSNRFSHPCRDCAMVFREFGIIKPLGKLADLRDDWSELVGWNCIEELAKCSEHKFLIDLGSTQMLLFHFSLS